MILSCSRFSHRPQCQHFVIIGHTVPERALFVRLKGGYIISRWGCQKDVNNGREFQLHNKFGLCTEQAEKQHLFCASSQHPPRKSKLSDCENINVKAMLVFTFISSRSPSPSRWRCSPWKTYQCNRAGLGHHHRVGELGSWEYPTVRSLQSPGWHVYHFEKRPMMPRCKIYDVTMSEMVAQK